MELFQQASRLKLRFDSPKGLLSVEDLWDLPLTSGAGKANLDDIAKGLNRLLKESREEVSFVKPVTNSIATEVQLAFDICKTVIDVRVAERDAKVEAEKRRETKQRILELIEKKKDQSLEGKSLEELMTMANSL